MSVSIDLDHTAGPAPQIIGPLFDWITITLNGANAIAALSEGVGDWYDAQASGYWTDLNELLVKAVHDPDMKAFSYAKDGLSGYRRNIAVHLTPDSTPIQLSAMPTAKNWAPLRLSFNPRNLPEGWTLDFCKIWAELDLGQIPFPALLSGASTTRVDAAFDVLGVRPADLLVMHPNLKKIWTASSPLGGFETQMFYVGAQHGKSPIFSPKKPAPLTMYDKRKQLEDTDQPPIYGDIEHTRLEFRDSKKRKLAEMLDLACPFKGWSIGRLTPDVFPFDPAKQQMLFDSIKVRGSAAAAELTGHVFSTTNMITSFHATLPADILSEATHWPLWTEAVEKSGVAQWVEWAGMHVGELLGVQFD